MQRAVRAALRHASPALAALDPGGSGPTETLAPGTRAPPRSSGSDAVQDSAAGPASSSSASSLGREGGMGASRALLPAAKVGAAEGGQVVPHWRLAAASTSREGVANAAGEHADLDAWILQNLGDEGARKARVDALVAQARPFSYAHSEVLQTLGNLYAHNVA